MDSVAQVVGETMESVQHMCEILYFSWQDILGGVLNVDKVIMFLKDTRQKKFEL